MKTVKANGSAIETHKQVSSSSMSPRSELRELPWRIEMVALHKLRPADRNARVAAPINVDVMPAAIKQEAAHAHWWTSIVLRHASNGLGAAVVRVRDRIEIDSEQRSIICF